MGRADGRVRPGQNIGSAFSARAWNRAQQAADVVLGDQLAVNVENSPQAANFSTILVRNDSGFAVPMLGVLLLGAPVVSPATGTLTADSAADFQAKQFLRRPVFVGTTPTANASQICLTLEPIQNGAIGRAIISGMTACKVKTVAGGPFYYAASRDADRTQLIVSSCGPARLVWHESGIGDDKWALVVL
jgi:hypothetical protein